MRHPVRLLVMFATASLAAIAAGCAAMAQSGVGTSSWLRNVVAWGVGGALAFALVRFGRPRGASAGGVILGTAALIFTLFGQAIDGAHRWLDIGPLHINVAALVLPALIVGLSAIRIATPTGVAVTLTVASVLLAQPDASQLTAFVIAALILFVGSAAVLRWKIAAFLVAGVFITAGWRRPDTLQPVAEVEQIFAMCVTVSPWLAAIAGLALAVAASAPLSVSPTGHHPGRGAAALCAYFVVVSIAPFVGWFPVPLVGLGMSFPVGWWLGVALLLVISHRHELLRPLSNGQKDVAVVGL